MTAKKVKAKTGIRFNAYTILERAVENGLAAGWRHAHKHTDDPAPDSIIEHMQQDIMLELSEVLQFEE